MTSGFLQNVKYYVNCKNSEKFFHVTLYQKSLIRKGFLKTCSLNIQMNDTNNVNIIEEEKVVKADKMIVNHLF